jgi:hypothetical protein
MKKFLSIAIPLLLAIYAGSMYHNYAAEIWGEVHSWTFLIGWVAAGITFILSASVVKGILYRVEAALQANHSTKVMKK